MLKAAYKALDKRRKKLDTLSSSLDGGTFKLVEWERTNL
jgi:hypothetical protein